MGHRDAVRVGEGGLLGGATNLDGDGVERGLGEDVRVGGFDGRRASDACAWIASSRASALRPALRYARAKRPSEGEAGEVSEPGSVSGVGVVHRSLARVGDGVESD